MSIIIGIDHGYYAIKTAHCSFPAGLTSYGEHEPYTRQGLLEVGGCFFVCGTGRQPIQRDKTANDNYYLLTLAAIAKEIQMRGLPPECSVRIAAGLPLTSFGRDKPKFRDYLFRTRQPVHFRFEGVEYSITIREVAIFPQGYAALMTETGLLQDEPSMLLMDLGGWTVDLMRIDNAIPVADTAHSLELGMIRCVDDIREQVRRETGLSLTDAQIENMLAGQPCTVSETVRDIVNRQGINNVGFWDSIPLWAVTLIGGLLITVLSFTMILTVYGRMFSLWMYAAIAPIPLSTFAGEPTSSVGKNFIRSYAGVCLQGVVIALSCIIFSAISSSPPAVDTGASVVTAVWTYVGELAFNLLVLVGAIKGCDRIVKEIMGL